MKKARTPLLTALLAAALSTNVIVADDFQKTNYTTIRQVTGDASVGSPSIIQAPDMSFLAYYKEQANENITGYINRSPRTNGNDNAFNWSSSPVANVPFTSGSLFSEGSHVYLIGVSGNKPAISRSSDNGSTWTSPTIITTVTGWWCGGVPVVKHNNRVYICFTDKNGAGIADPDGDGTLWPSTRRAVMLSAPLSGLMTASNWSISNELECPGMAPNGKRGWLEGNVVPHNGGLKVIMRVDNREENDLGNVGAILNYNTSTNALSFNKFITVPGGQSKFHIQYDSAQSRYFMLSNPYLGASSDFSRHTFVRNVLAVYESTDLENWKWVKKLISDDVEEHWKASARYTGFQQPSFLKKGNNLYYLSRTAYGDSPNYHDAHYITLHKLWGIDSILNFDKCVAHYDFEFSNDPGQDKSRQKGNHADPVNNPTHTSAGKIGDGLIFDGVDDYLDLGMRVDPEFHLASQITFAAWINNDTNGTDFFSCPMDGSNAGLTLRIEGDGTLKVGSRSNANDSYRISIFNFGYKGVWTHLAVIWDFQNDQIKVYVNGVSQTQSVSFPSSQYTRGRPIYNAVIGKHYKMERNFKGKMDEVYLYNKGLGSSEVQNLYNAGL